MEIRKIKIEDGENLLEFFHELVAADTERVERPQDVENITLEMEENWIMSRIKKEDEEKEMVVRIIKDGGKIVAEGEIEKLGRWIERHVAEIRFGMLPGNEEQTLEMVNELCSNAKKIGIEILQYFHLETQKSGIEIMKKAGFSEFGRAEKHYKRGSEYIDRIYMQKVL
jgi:L-amino acid N-acyltransferase YncA